MEETLSATEYEELVQSLVQGFGIAYGENSLRGGKSNLVRGASGYAHQIDVSIHLPKEIVLIECKRLKRHVQVSHALTLAARLLDIREGNPTLRVSASLVSMSSVAVGCFKIASHYGLSVDQVMGLDEYAMTILKRHHVGLRSAVQAADAADILVNGRG